MYLHHDSTCLWRPKFEIFCDSIDNLYFSAAVNTAKIVDQLNLQKLTGRKWYVQGTCATNGQGIYEGMNQLSSMVREFKKRS